MDISGQVAIVTGGASGLGAATARKLASLGAKVGILDFDADRGSAMAAEIGGHAVKTDVSSEDSVAAAIASVKETLGAPRVAVNCAGVGLAARVVGREGKLSTDVFDKTIKVNLYGTYNVMSYAMREMAALDPLDNGERGVVINTASVAFQDGQVGQAAYAASKGAIAAMTLPVAREMAKLGVRIMTIAPGLFNTPMMESLPEETVQGIIANIPFPHRLGNPEEYGLLVSQIIANPYLNGETIRLDAATRLPQR